MQKVFSTFDVALLNRIKAELELAGIPCFSRNELSVGGAAGEIAPLVLPPELWIAADEDLEKALTLVNSLSRPLPRDATPYTCTGCGEEIEPAFDACWQCGTERRVPARGNG